MTKKIMITRKSRKGNSCPHGILLVKGTNVGKKQFDEFREALQKEIGKGGLIVVKFDSDPTVQYIKL